MNRTESDKGQSEFNMAVSYLGRLNFLFSQADEAAITLDPHSWYHILRAIYRELSTEITDKTKWENRSNEINNLLTQHLNQKNRTGNPTIQPELYQALDKYEISLRAAMDNAGLQVKRQMDAGNVLN